MNRMSSFNDPTLDAVLRTALDSVVVIREDGTIAAWNHVAERTFGWSFAEVEGLVLSDLIIPEEMRRHHDDGMRRYLQTGIARALGLHIEVVAMDRAGRHFPVELSTTVSTQFGERLFLGFLRDISARKDTDAQIAMLQAELVHASRATAMGTMAAVIGHELNQPLAAAFNYMGGTQRLMENSAQTLPDGMWEGVRGAHGQLLRASEIVRRFRAMLGGQSAFREKVWIRALFHDTCALLTLSGRWSKTITISIAPHAKGFVGDKVQIEQVLLNLLQNAADAINTMPGSAPADGDIGLEASLEPDGDIRMCVVDRGPGIVPAVRDQLFSAFRSSKAGGLGLGLSICRTIVEAHHGSLWLDDDKLEGSRFCLSVPRDWEQLGEGRTPATQQNPIVPAELLAAGDGGPDRAVATPAI